MSNSDSSDNEELLKALKESESNFAKNLYSTIIKEEREDSKPLPQSLRCTDDQLDHKNAVGLFVTPGVQKHIAKHLSSILDQQLEEVQYSKEKKNRTVINEDFGINLFKCSRVFLSNDDIEDISAAHNVRCKRRKSERNSDEEMIKVKESAVSADWVLSGEAVKGWEKSTKGEVIPGILKNNVVNKKKKRKKKNKSAVSETVR